MLLKTAVNIGYSSVLPLMVFVLLIMLLSLKRPPVQPCSMVCGPTLRVTLSGRHRLMLWSAVPFRDLPSSKKCFFTDGSCLFPAVPDIRVAAAAVITPCGEGTFDTIWAGSLPTSHQTIPRAEVLAGAIATGSAFIQLSFPIAACRCLLCWSLSPLAH